MESDNGKTNPTENLPQSPKQSGKGLSQSAPSPLETLSSSDQSRSHNQMITRSVDEATSANCNPMQSQWQKSSQSSELSTPPTSYQFLQDSPKEDEDHVLLQSTGTEVSDDFCIIWEQVTKSLELDQLKQETLEEKSQEDEPQTLGTCISSAITMLIPENENADLNILELGKESDNVHVANDEDNIQVDEGADNTENVNINKTSNSNDPLQLQAKEDEKDCEKDCEKDSDNNKPPKKRIRYRKAKKSPVEQKLARDRVNELSRARDKKIVDSIEQLAQMLPYMPTGVHKYCRLGKPTQSVILTGSIQYLRKLSQQMDRLHVLEKMYEKSLEENRRLATIIERIEGKLNLSSSENTNQINENPIKISENTNFINENSNPIDDKPPLIDNNATDDEGNVPMQK